MTYTSLMTGSPTNIESGDVFDLRWASSSGTIFGFLFGGVDGELALEQFEVLHDLGQGAFAADLLGAVAPAERTFLVQA